MEVEEVEGRERKPLLGTGPIVKRSDSISLAKEFLSIFLNPATSLCQLASGFISSHFCT